METPVQRKLSEGAWAARLPAALAHQVAVLRDCTGIEVAERGEHVWLRGADSTKEMEARLKGVPDLERFRRVEGERLVPVGCRVPTLVLPALEWAAIKAFFALELGAPALAGVSERTVKWSLVRDANEEPVNALIVDLEAFVAWCETAPLVRLMALEFAASSDRRVLVRGSPLPPIVGLPLVLRERVACPAGWRSDPDLDAPSLLRLFGAAAGEIAILHPPDSFELVPADAFVRATRAAARATRDEARRA